MLIDSNILIYAINEASPKQKKAQKFLKENISSLIISHQVVLETIRVLTHPKFSNPMKTTDAVRSISAIASSCQIITPTPMTYYLTFEYIKKFKLCGNRIFDAYLVATAISNGIYEIATDNERDFQKFKEVKIVNPF